MGIDPDVQPFLDVLAVKAATATSLAKIGNYWAG